ncbi:MAG: hypothetical protein RL535_1249, partial [Pseudomonadota bacterium]
MNQSNKPNINSLIMDIAQKRVRKAVF